MTSKARDIADLGSNDVLETTSTGLDVTGTVTADGLTVDGGAYSEIYLDSNLGALSYEASSGDFRFYNSGSKRLNIANNGDVSFYEDTGTTAKMVWDASAESLGIRKGVYSSTFDLNLSGEGLAIKNDRDGSDNNWSAIRNTGILSESNISFVSGQGEALVVAHNRNVGIGTASPSAKLDVVGAIDAESINVVKNQTSDTAIEVANVGTASASTTSSFILSESAGTPKGWFRRYRDGTARTSIGYSTNLTFEDVSGSERARIDSSGNLLVGKTSTLIAVDGTYIGANGVVEMVTDGSAPLRLNRKTNNGEIIQLRKDGSTVGSIGTFGSTAVIQSGSAADYCGLLFNNSGGQGYIEPTKATVASGSNPRTDNAVNIGSSTYRFKDLYLSGTIRSVSIYNNTSSGNANLGISAGGEVYRSTSSIKYKEDVQDAQHGLTEVMTLRPVTYRGINDGDTVFGGLIAEEVHDAGLTEFVEYNEDNEPDALAYANMVSLCIKAIQDQQEIIDSLKTRIETLENN